MAIADHLGCSETTVRRVLKKLKLKREPTPGHLLQGAHWVELDTPLVIRDTAVMVTADWHIPLYSPSLVNEMIETARRKDIRTLIVAGDFFNFDALSKYDPKQHSANLTAEYEEGLKVMSTLLETFDTIVYLWGNHDARLHKALGHKMQFVVAMKMVFGALGEDACDKILFSNLDYCLVEFGSEVYRVCHPDSYTRVPLSTARQLCSKYNTHIITAHSHHCAVGYGPDALKLVAEIGGLFDATKTQYLQRSTTFPAWQQGYGWFTADGGFVLKSPLWMGTGGADE